jgi:hypothetical protein
VGREVWVTASPGNEEIARDVNDHIRDVLWAFESSHGEFFCECDRIGCTERIAITVGEYDVLRAGGNGARLLAVEHNGAPS